MEATLGRLFLFSFLIPLSAWIFIPRTLYYGDYIMVYPVEMGFCNQQGGCDVKQFLTPVKLRVDPPKAQVVWLNTENGEVGSWLGCTIAEKENWACSSPVLKMSDGYLISDQSNLKYLSGWWYRTLWLLSFLPDLR